jgi:hypothetical protein
MSLFFSVCVFVFLEPDESIPLTPITVWAVALVSILKCYNYRHAFSLSCSFNGEEGPSMFCTIPKAMQPH